MKIYKYCHFTPRVLENISENKIWFSRATELNDPFECDFGVKNFQEYITAKHPLAQGLETDEDRAIFIQDVRKARKRKLLIHSSSEDPTIPLLWAHYSNAHMGVCLEIEADAKAIAAVKSLPGKFVSTSVIDKVRYSTDELFISKDAVPILDVVYKKHSDWEYEKELRMAMVTDADFPNAGYSLSGCSGIRYTKLILGLRFPPSEIDNIAKSCETHKVKLAMAVQCHGRYRIRTMDL